MRSSVAFPGQNTPKKKLQWSWLSGLGKRYLVPCPIEGYGKGVSANLRQGASWKLDQERSQRSHAVPYRTVPVATLDWQHFDWTARRVVPRVGVRGKEAASLHLSAQVMSLMSVDKGCAEGSPSWAGEGPYVREESCPLGQISMRKQLKISSPISCIFLQFVVVVPLCGHFDGTVLFSFEIYARRD